jgi:hypothetical protein
VSARRDPNVVGLDFLRTELSAGMMFATFAADAVRDTEKPESPTRR